MESSDGAGGNNVLGCGGGCLDLRAARVSSSRSVRESSEQARWTAPLKSPSSNLAETRAARVVRGSRLYLGRSLPVRGRGMKWRVYFIHQLLVHRRRERLRRWPPLLGGRKRREGNLKRRARVPTSLHSVIASSMAAILDVAEEREVRGILFKILVADLKDAGLSRVSSGGIAEVATEEATQVRVEESSLAGGLPEPEQRLLAGLWE